MVLDSGEAHIRRMIFGWSVRYDEITIKNAIARPSVYYNDNAGSWDLSFTFTCCCELLADLEMHTLIKCAKLRIARAARNSVPVGVWRVESVGVT